MEVFTASVAVGQRYEIEAQRILKEYPETFLITERSPGVETKYSVPLLNGLATKCKFGTLLPDSVDKPIIFFDADLVPMIPNPLQHFRVKDETEIAMVPYPGKWHTPDDAFTKALQRYGNLNSGFIYFKNLKIAKDFCTLWHKKYLERIDDYLSGKIKTDRTGEFDEPSLVFVLANSDYIFEPLDPKWNVWGNDMTLENGCSHEVKNPYFRQMHIGWSPYEENPTIS